MTQGPGITLFAYRTIRCDVDVVEGSKGPTLHFRAQVDANGMTVPVDLFDPRHVRGLADRLQPVERLLSIAAQAGQPPASLDQVKQVAVALGPLFTPFPDQQAFFGAGMLEPVRQWLSFAADINTAMEAAQRLPTASRTAPTDEERLEVSREFIIAKIGHDAFQSLLPERQESLLQAYMPPALSEHDLLTDSTSRLIDNIWDRPPPKYVASDNEVSAQLNMSRGAQALAWLVLFRPDLYAGRVLQRCARSGCRNIRLMRPSVRQVCCSESCRMARNQKQYRDRKKQKLAVTREEQRES